MNWKGFFLWWSDFLTEFENGFVRGLFPGTGVGGVAVGNTDTTETSVLLSVGLGALIVTACFNGLTHAGIWARDNKIPNPFRPPSNDT